MGYFNLDAACFDFKGSKLIFDHSSDSLLIQLLQMTILIMVDAISKILQNSIRKLGRNDDTFFNYTKPFI